MSNSAVLLKQDFRDLIIDNHRLPQQWDYVTGGRTRCLQLFTFMKQENFTCIVRKVLDG